MNDILNIVAPWISLATLHSQWGSAMPLDNKKPTRPLARVGGWIKTLGQGRFLQLATLRSPRRR